MDWVLYSVEQSIDTVLWQGAYFVTNTPKWTIEAHPCTAEYFE